MTMSLVWYVLAGVLLGFAASTLWEWLYFRNKRMTLENGRVEELEAQLAEEQALNEQMRLAQSAAASQPPSYYASPGVFLDSESEPAQPVGASTAVAAPAAVTAAQYAAPAPPETVPVVPVAVDAAVSAQNPPHPPGDATARPQSDPAEMDPPTPDAGRAAIAAAAVAAGADTDQNTGAYVDALADVEEYSDETTALERLAAELALDPGETTAPPVTDPLTPYAVRSTDHPDNLSLIKGIGDVYKFRLYAAGIFTWHQIAESDLETLRVATNAYPGSNVEEWGPQARGLAEKHARQGAFYTGPVPDDLTQIIGIGPVGERTLFHAGICTYAQLAGATMSELQVLFPIAIAGDEPDFAQWIQLAIEMANRNDGK